MISPDGFFMCAKIVPFALLFFVVAGLLRSEEPVLTSLPLIDANALVTLKTHCYSCHSQSSEKLRGNFKLDQLTSNFEDRSNRDAWQLVFKKIKSGEMPPKEKTKPHC